MNPVRTENQQPANRRLQWGIRRDTIHVDESLQAKLSVGTQKATCLKLSRGIAHVKRLQYDVRWSCRQPEAMPLVGHDRQY
jgi:hypothetical protein